VNTIEQQKHAAAIAGAGYIQDGMRVGLGTGSTVGYLLDYIAEQRSRGEWQNIRGVPTSRATEMRVRKLGIPLCTLAEAPELDLTIDGADEVAPDLSLIKGLGGALLREKVVAAASRLLVIIADEAKLVERLGTRAPVPVEVDAFGLAVQERWLRELGAEPVLRRMEDGQPYSTDGGNQIFDCWFRGGIVDPADLECKLNNLPGVLENGLFVNRVHAAVVAGPGGVRTRTRGVA
jgi:ribose 5-phosphate isomerase A